LARSLGAQSLSRQPAVGFIGIGRRLPLNYDQFAALQQTNH
jgi:hypothetical protein